MVKSNNEPLFFILGPCVLENKDHALSLASFLKELSIKLNFNVIFKASFDKANRTAGTNYRGVGIEEGCSIFKAVKNQFNLLTTTDIHEAWQAEVIAPYVDVIQIPAMLCRQTDLLQAAGKTGKVVNIKKGQFLPPHAMKHAAEKVKLSGKENIWLCERGFSFGYGDLIVDFRNFPLMKQLGYPIVFDATHSVQKPNALGHATGGDRSQVADLTIAAVSQGIAGLFMEVHEDPEKALSDGPNSLRLSHLEDFIKYIIELDNWVKSKKRPVVY